MMRDTTNNTRNTKNRIWAAALEEAATFVNPNRAAIRATTRKMSAHLSMGYLRLLVRVGAYRNCPGAAGQADTGRVYLVRQADSLTGRGGLTGSRRVRDSIGYECSLRAKPRPGPGGLSARTFGRTDPGLRRAPPISECGRSQPAIIATPTRRRKEDQRWRPRRGRPRSIRSG